MNGTFLRARGARELSPFSFKGVWGSFPLSSLVGARCEQGCRYGANRSPETVLSGETTVDTPPLFPLSGGVCCLGEKARVGDAYPYG